MLKQRLTKADLAHHLREPLSLFRVTVRRKKALGLSANQVHEDIHATVGLSASTCRAIQNGQTTTPSSETLGKLNDWALQQYSL